MIKNDFRYIIKKILIGIGIILGISFIRSCNVYALEDRFYPLINNQECNSSTNCITHSIGDKYSYIIDNNEYIIEYKNSGIYINNILAYSSSNNNWLKMPWFLLKWENTNNVSFYLMYNFSHSNDYFNLNALVNNLEGNSDIELSSIIKNYPIKGNRICQGFSHNRHRINFTNGVYSNDNDLSVPFYNDWNYCAVLNYNYILYGASTNYRIEINDYSYRTNQFYSTDFTKLVQIPEIISLNSKLNKTDDNMLVSVSFSPEFSFVDTDNYNYFAWFDDEKKFSLTQNNVKFNTQNNTTFFVEITDKKGNSIDTETYTVSSIGLVYNGNYDIQFITNEYTDSDTSNNSDLLIDSINRIDIDITYIPKWVNYKYQYQFVPQNSSITDDWVLVNDNNDKNNIVYSASSNGTMYARILDKDNKVLKSETFTITRIGELKYYDNNSNKIFSIFNKINNDINFGGPVSNLITIPVNVVETILQAGSNKCTPYYLGSINGHSLSLTCINPEDYLGSALWSTIDIIVSGCMIYSIFKWLTSLYWNFVILSDTPDIDPSTFGDRRDLK